MSKVKIQREEVFKLIENIRDILNDKKILLLHFDKLFSDDEQTEIDVYFQGVSNGFLSEIFHSITGYEVEVIGEVEKLFISPCCGLKTLTEPSLEPGTGYDICPYCKWENDGTSDIDSYKSINKGSISNYRDKIKNNFNEYYIDKWFR